jgi:hypothetical protein
MTGSQSSGVYIAEENMKSEAKNWGVVGVARIRKGGREQNALQSRNVLIPWKR